MKFKGLKPKKKAEPSGVAESKNECFRVPATHIEPDSAPQKDSTKIEVSPGSLALPIQPYPKTRLSPLSVFPEFVRI